MIWFSSDFHFCHKNIVYGVSNWGDKSGCRAFNTIEEMNNTIINNLNSKIAPEDTLYCLGDFAFSGTKNYFIWREKINCKNIHLIFGNHDNKHGQVFDPEWNGKKTSSLFTTYSQYKEIYCNNTKMCLFHYPISSWNEMSGGSIHLFGHCHSLKQDKFFNGGKSREVGLDGNNFFPYSIDEIFDIFKETTALKEGHHQ